MATAVVEWLSPFVPESKLLLIGAASAATLYTLTKKRYKYPPGPMGLPLFGSLLSLRKTGLLDKVPEWQEQYGPIFTVDLGPLRLVIVNSKDLLVEAFVKKSADFAGRPQFYSAGVFNSGGKSIITTDYGPAWQVLRRLGLKALGSYLKGVRYQETFDEVLQMGFSEIRKGKGAIDLLPYIEFIVFNLINQVCFSEMLPMDNEVFHRISRVLQEINEESNDGFLEDFFPPLRLWPTKKFQHVQALFKELIGYNMGKMKEHKATFEPDFERDLTDAILIAKEKMAEDEDPELMAQLTDYDFVHVLNDIFFAGTDTTRQSIYWIVLYIAAHPEVQKKIHEEVDSVLGARPTAMRSDRENLPYTEAVLYEGMRIATVTPFAVPHTTTCDTSLGGYTLPKGTFIFPNLHAVHHDPQLWDNPWKFKPERFLDARGRFTRQDGWMPFSVGKRACMAESLAKPHLHMVLASLYRNFEIHLPKGVEADFEPNKAGIVYLTKPYKVVIKDRFA